MVKSLQLIISLISIYLYFTSCSRDDFDIRNDKIRALIKVGSDSIHFSKYFPDRDVRKNLHKEFKDFYKKRAFNLAWLRFDKPKKQVNELLQTLEAAPEHGLQEDNYNIKKIESLLHAIYDIDGKKEKRKSWRKNFKTKADKEKLRHQDTVKFKNITQLDFLLTASYLTYASHLLYGIIDPIEQGNWLPQHPRKKLAPHLEKALKKNEIKASLEALAPTHEQYKLLRGYLKYLRQTDGDTVPLITTTLKRGDKGEEVLKAKKRLRLWKHIDHGMNNPMAFDKKMEVAVRQFQRNNGMEASGEINSQVLNLLNRPVSYWLSKIEANMERMRWLQRNFSDEYLLVNIPAYELSIMKNNVPEVKMKVIVGTSYKKTPVFSDTLEYIVFNPTWTVPNSIAIEEMLPLLKEDDEYLSSRDLKLYDGWGPKAKLIDPEDVDWDDVDSVNWKYRIVEDPGPSNSLGRIKFMLPNDQAIYLHDTPAGHLFGEKNRNFSHGCIRVENPVTLAEYLLGWDQKQVKEYINSEETQDVPLDKKIPVHIVYWSAWVDKEGINFRSDIYDHDRHQRRKMELKKKSL